MNIYKEAASRNLTFPSPTGAVTLQQLFTLPLYSKMVKSASLDSVGRMIYAAQSECEKTSEFSLTGKSPKLAGVDDLELCMQIIQDIAKDREAQTEASIKAAEKRSKLNQLLALQEAKKLEALNNLSAEEIEAQIEALR